MLVVFKWIMKVNVPLAYGVLKVGCPGMGAVLSIFNDSPFYVNSPDS